MADKNKDLRLDFDEVMKLLKTLNADMNKAYVREMFNVSTKQSLLAYLNRRLKVNFCDPMMSICQCPLSVNNLLKTTSPKPLGGLSPNFTGMILGWSYFEFVQTISIPCRILVAMATKRNNLKNYCQILLVRF